MKEEKRGGFGWAAGLAVLLNPVFLVVYGVALRYLERLCRVGSLRSNGLWAAVLGGICLVWLVGWGLFCLMARRRGRSLGGGRKLWRGVLILELAAALGLSGFYGYRIFQSAGDFTTKLGGYVYQWRNTETWELQADNLYEDGLDGLFAELDRHLDLPEELYLVRAVEINFQEDGTITEIYAFLYGQNDQGEGHTYLVDYRRSSSQKVTVWLDGYADLTYQPEQQLQPFLELVSRLDLRQETAGWQAETRQLLYDGSRYFSAGTGQVFVVAEDGSQTLETEGAYGYEVSLWDPDSETSAGGIAQGQEVKRFFAGWDVAGAGTGALTGPAASEAEAAWEETETGDAEAGSGLPVGESFVESGEDIAFFLDYQVGYCLRVADAAAGSRFFQLEKTEDGGENWTLWNEDPFGGVLGGGVDLKFLDENLGFLTIWGASGSSAQLYRTEDGGTSFEEVELPAAEGYDFPELPALDGGRLTITVGRGAESDGPEDVIRLYSEDQGRTWSLDSGAGGPAA